MPDNFQFPPRRDEDPMADIQRIIDQVRSGLGGLGGAGGGGWPRLNPWAALAILLLIYAGSGIFIVRPDERGVVLRFGRVVREVDPGPGYHLPWPVEQVIKPAVTQIRKAEFGFRTVDIGPPARYRAVDPEALMLTGDENIVKLQFIVQYKVKTGVAGPSDFLFNVRDPEQTVRDAAEAATREVVARTNIDDALTEGKERIQQDAQVLLQRTLDEYGVGLEVVTLKLQDVDPPTQVSDAFKDVISAQQDKERLINEARGYANDVVPKARGRAAEMINEAEGQSQAKITEAEGAAQRFVAVQEEYEKAKDVTRTRLYLETMEQILPRVSKIVLDEVAGKQIVPYLPLDRAARPPAVEAEKP